MSDNSRYPYGGGGQGSVKQNQYNNQKTLVDQHYSNEIFFAMLSTLESLVLACQNKQASHYNEKMFRSYDRTNYSGKTIPELKSQLQTHIMLFQASRVSFVHENKGIQWQLPKNFDVNQAMSFIDYAINIFQQKGQTDVILMARDIQQLLNGKLSGLHVEKHDYNIKYTQKEKAQLNKNLFQNGVRATEYMEKAKEDVKDVKDKRQLQARVNLKNPHYNQKHPSEMVPEISNTGQQSCLKREQSFQPLKNNIGQKYWVLLFEVNLHFNYAGEHVDIGAFEKKNKAMRIFDHPDGILVYRTQNTKYYPREKAMKCYQVEIANQNKIKIIKTLECFYSSYQGWRLH